MKKLAIFVEGQTEQLFVEQLVLEIAGTNGIRIDKVKATGGGKAGRRQLREVEASSVDSGQQYYVLIWDSGCDNRVKSDIMDQYNGLVASQYNAIIGIRDVFPEFTQADVPELMSRLQYRMKTKPIKVTLVLAIMEIEAWFMVEHTHFLKISEALTLERVAALLGFDPSTGNVEERTNPATDLHTVYSFAGFGYKKSKTQVQRTISALDYNLLYLESSTRVTSLRQLISAVDNFLTAA